MSGDKYGRDHEKVQWVIPPGSDIARNPLTDGALRNCPCLCGSGKKIKKCCGQKRVVPSKFAEALKRMSLDGKLMKELAAQNTTEGVSDGHTDERS